MLRKEVEKGEIEKENLSQKWIKASKMGSQYEKLNRKFMKL